MTELKVPLFESYLEIQTAARDEAGYLNREIASKLGISFINLEILVEASEHPDIYKLLDNNKNPLKPREIRNKRFLRYNGAVTFDSDTFELWYHNFHPEGKQRAAFFEGLGDKERMQLKYYKEK